jgi:exosortase
MHRLWPYLKVRLQSLPIINIQAKIIVSNIQKRHLAFVSLLLFSLAAFWRPIGNLVRLAFNDGRYSHLLAIPAITVFLFYSKRKNTFLSARCDIGLALALLSVGTILYAATGLIPPWLGLHWLTLDVQLSSTVCALIFVWFGAFCLCYGKKAFWHFMFPLLFLFLLVPLPSAVVDKAVVTLQHGSATTACDLFKLLGIPVLAQGVNLSLPGINIEVAKECSGIRSCESLVITSLLAGYYLLQSAGGRIVLVVLSIPIAILKNAIRITVISCLGIYVNRGFFYGNLHRNGGLPFSLVALVMILIAICLFRRCEAHARKAPASEEVQC